MRAKLFVNGFIRYWIFAIIGANLHIGPTAFSFGNLSLIVLAAVVYHFRDSELLYVGLKLKRLGKKAY